MNCPSCKYSYIYESKTEMWVLKCLNCGNLDRVVTDEEMEKLTSGPRPFTVVKCKDTFDNKEDLK